MLRGDSPRESLLRFKSHVFLHGTPTLLPCTWCDLHGIGLNEGYIAKCFDRPIYVNHDVTIKGKIFRPFSLYGQLFGTVLILKMFHKTMLKFFFFFFAKFTFRRLFRIWWNTVDIFWVWVRAPKLECRNDLTKGPKLHILLFCCFNGFFSILIILH